jgi:hypothetical protein
MHPHIAQFIATDRIDGLVGTAARERLAHSANRRLHRPSWRERLTHALRRRPVGAGHRGAVRQA